MAAKKIGNSSVDAHNARAAEFAKNERIFQDAASRYVKDKGYSESSMEATRRAAKAGGYKNKVRVGNYGQEI